MKKLLAAFALLILGACATAGLDLAKGQLTVDATYNAAVHWYNNPTNQASLTPAVKATMKADLLKVYICHPPAVGPTTDADCAGYLKDFHDAVADGNLAAQEQWLPLINQLLGQIHAAQTGGRTP